MPLRSHNLTAVRASLRQAEDEPIAPSEMMLPLETVGSLGVNDEGGDMKKSREEGGERLGREVGREEREEWQGNEEGRKER